MDESKSVLEKLEKAAFSRRSFIKLSGMGVTAVAAAGATEALAGPRNPKIGAFAGKKLAMVIDLQKCSGCGGCMITCKQENNVQEGHKWSFKIASTTGKFPDVQYEYLPCLCNHCDNAPCVSICPVNAMHKNEGGITMHNPKTCIGCKQCIGKCPYGVISFHARDPHKNWKSHRPAIMRCTSSPVQTVRASGGKVIPYYNPDREGTFPGRDGTRRQGIVEKCTFCDHRTRHGEIPYCAAGCPAKARVFGDLNDPASEVSKLLRKYPHFRRKESLGTEPKVYYVRAHPNTKLKGL